MIAKLAEMGILVSLERVKELSQGGSIGRPHIAQVMLENRQITSFREAFDKYISHDGPAYVEREKITLSRQYNYDTVRSVTGSSTPSKFRGSGCHTKPIARCRISWLETYYGCYTGEVIENLTGVAKRHGLIPTGGSDYHGISAGDIGAEIGSIDVPVESFEQLAILSRNRKTKR